MTTTDDATRDAARLICGDIIAENERLREGLRGVERRTLEGVCELLRDRIAELMRKRDGTWIVGNSKQTDCFVAANRATIWQLEKRIAALDTGERT
jgi:hypothetical protein